MTTRHAIQIRGAVGQLWERYWANSPPPITLVDGPAGTGKTFAILFMLVELAKKYPGLRWPIMRKTRQHMSETTLEALEKVLALACPEALRGPRREGRSIYRLPNGSSFPIMGLDDPGRALSGQFHGIFWNEGVQFSRTDFEGIMRALRGDLDDELPRVGSSPIVQLPFPPTLIIDTNPDHEKHWLNLSATKGEMERFVSRHEDNPALCSPDGAWKPKAIEYFAKLNRMTGPRLQRMRYGKWTSAEGMIWPNWDPLTHIVDPGEPDPDNNRPWGKNVPPFRYYLCGWDFAARAPGCLLVAGVDDRHRLWIVEQYYRCEVDGRWWTARHSSVWRRLRHRMTLADGAEPDRIYQANQDIDGRVTVIAADKRREHGWDIVRDKLSPDHSGGPQIFVLRNSLKDEDQHLKEQMLPTRLEDEIPGYVWVETKDGQRVREEPDPAAPDHACDALRYLATFHWRVELGSDSAHDYGEMSAWDQFNDDSLVA
ncbi:MAG: hypothetical protein RIB60_06140 [Phycisphaerales bacterium]